MGNRFLVAGVFLLLANTVFALDESPVAPEFTLQSLSAGKLSLSDYRGKVVLLNFWATWCMPCRQEMPSMERLWQQYQNKGFAILAVSTDEGGASRVKSFVKRLKLSFPVVLDADSKVSDLYQVSGLPVSFLVDRQGRVAAKITGSADWMDDKAIARIEGLLHAQDN
jgi:peroxiredoxin